MKSTKILWFTGLSGSGKTEISKGLIKKLEELGKSYKIFDGDDVREKLHKALGFTPEDIRLNNSLIMDLCRKELGRVDFILVPIISPFKESRRKAKKLFGEKFIEIYVNCPYEECKIRDVKGLYKKAESGEIQNFIGLHIPYEAPENPDIEINTAEIDVNTSINKIVNFLDLEG